MEHNSNFSQIHEKVIKGLELAYARMVQYKRRINSPIVVAQNGKVVELDPFEAPDEVSYNLTPTPLASPPDPLGLTPRPPWPHPPAPSPKERGCQQTEIE